MADGSINNDTSGNYNITISNYEKVSLRGRAEKKALENAGGKSLIEIDQMVEDYYTKALSDFKTSIEKAQSYRASAKIPSIFDPRAVGGDASIPHINRYVVEAAFVCTFTALMAEVVKMRREKMGGEIEFAREMLSMMQAMLDLSIEGIKAAGEAEAKKHRADAAAAFVSCGTACVALGASGTARSRAKNSNSVKVQKKKTTDLKSEHSKAKKISEFKRANPGDDGIREQATTNVDKGINDKGDSPPSADDKNKRIDAEANELAKSHNSGDPTRVDAEAKVGSKPDNESAADYEGRVAEEQEKMTADSKKKSEELEGKIEESQSQEENLISNEVRTNIDVIQLFRGAVDNAIKGVVSSLKAGYEIEAAEAKVLENLGGKQDPIYSGFRQEAMQMLRQTAQENAKDLDAYTQLSRMATKSFDMRG